MTDLRAIAWPARRAGEAVEALAKAAGFAIPALPPQAEWTSGAMDDEALARWVDMAALRLGLEAEPVRATYGEVSAVVRGVAPALLHVHDEGLLVVAILAVKGRRAVVVTPDHGRLTVSLATLEDALWMPIERAAGDRVDGILTRAQIPVKRRPRARRALLRDPCAGEVLDAGWMLRLPPSATVRAQVQRAALPRTLTVMLIATVAGNLLSLGAWWLIGRGALGGTLDRGWMIAWALLLFTVIPIRVAGAWWQGLAGVTASALLKRRLLVGALRLDPEEVRGEGTGQILGRVIEAEALEGLSVGGGFGAILAAVELATAAPVLALSVGGVVAAVALGGWTLLAVAVIARYARRMETWTRARVRMTDDLVERLVGHRTRIAQEPPGSWHDDEDRALSDYVDRSTRLDFISVLAGGFLARGWTIVGFLALAPGFLGHQTTPGSIAVGIGGVLLARGAFVRLTGGMASLAAAQVAWKQVSTVFHSAARPESVGTASAQAVEARESPGDEPLLVASDVVFRYRPQAEPALRKVAIRIQPNDRILVEGPSGGGKSTLGSVLTGLRAPESGLLLLDGLDRHTLGALGWRRRVVAAPQFHENHVLSNTLAFNLLMGRRWPPQPGDLAEARAVCLELGLGPLLDRMPSGLAQMVGETGWQLSHGEKSRLFIARALLQRSRLIVLDESFAALDPETLSQALRSVLARAPALIVIAHP